ncbi:zinc-ribbon domain-containing protein [Nitrosomonas marina]|uniref:Zinc-ribbon domain-containing protein n=1 Tax=Nitrosomonas marina TaxID=917 RepID=A0A1H9ZKG6_9PROT|nr:zinc ribbon domain-containing protein [Nitrosomonas marina]SES82216.1 zinc-ribbon domain-containing protein [Nitrosomonas marina]
MLCPNCGAQNSEQADYCTQCAAPLKTEAVHSAQVQDNDATRATSQSADHDDTVASTVRSQDYSSRENGAGEPLKPRITNLDFQSDKAASEKPVVSPGLNIGIFIGTLILPIIGIAMGFTYMRKAHPDAKRAGKNWLIFGLVMMLINIAVIYF